MPTIAENKDLFDSSYDWSGPNGGAWRKRNGQVLYIRVYSLS
jgi:hypothetical protein